MPLLAQPQSCVSEPAGVMRVLPSVMFSIVDDAVALPAGGEALTRTCREGSVLGPLRPLPQATRQTHEPVVLKTTNTWSRFTQRHPGRVGGRASRCTGLGVGMPSDSRKSSTLTRSALPPQAGPDHPGPSAGDHRVPVLIMLITGVGGSRRTTHKVRPQTPPPPGSNEKPVATRVRGRDGIRARQGRGPRFWDFLHPLGKSNTAPQRVVPLFRRSPGNVVS
jgi:hypothetical protein